MSRLPALMFWPGSHPGGDDATLEASEAGRITTAAVSPVTIQQLLDSGMNGAEIQARAKRHGVRLTQLDGATSRAPARFFEPIRAELKARFDFCDTQIRDLATTAGMNAILATGAFGPSRSQVTTSPPPSPRFATGLPTVLGGSCVGWDEDGLGCWPHERPPG